MDPRGSWVSPEITTFPTGTVSFLFTDIEGSTRLLQQLGASYRDVLQEHRRILGVAFEAAGGRIVGTEGDSLFVAFPQATAAVRAAAAAQEALARSAWPGGIDLKVRMGIHTGEADLSEGSYVGLDVHRAARIAAAAHGGQVLLSATTVELASDAFSEALRVRDLGQHRLRDLSRAQHLYQLVIGNLASDFPPPKTDRPAIDSLPVQLTSFIGRERELAQAAGLLESGRLLTLVGPGGSGKTRLALELAGRLAERFPDGVRYVPLAAFSESEMVPAAIGQALQLLEAGRGHEPIDERLRQYVRNRELLLVIDNFEQVLAAAHVLSDLLGSGAKTRMIVTSRAALRVAGEQEFRVPPLGLPDPDRAPNAKSLSEFEATALFIQRASVVRPDFVVTGENAPAIAEICRRLDGLPLAIELAASRVRILTPQAILRRLGRRLVLLSGGSVNLPARQQTLRAAIEWSHQLLTPDEQRLFARLAVFAGGGALDQIERVCGPTQEPPGIDVLEGLTSLTDKSLLNATEDYGGEPRFGMLQTIREFASERLSDGGEEDAVRDRHLEAYASLAAEGAPNLLRSGRREWLDRLELELDNFRAALDWALAQPDLELGLRLGAALWRVWQMRGHLGEGREWLDRLVKRARSSGLIDPALLMAAFEGLGGIAHWQGDQVAQREYYGEALQLARASGDPAAIGEALYDLSYAFELWSEPPHNDPEIPRRLLDEAMTHFEAIGDVGGIGRVRHARGVQAFFRGDPEGGRRESLAALTIHRKTDEVHYIGWSSSILGLSQIQLGDVEQGVAAIKDALRVFAAARDISGIAGMLEHLGNIALQQGDEQRGIRLKGASAGLTASSGADLLATVLNLRIVPGGRSDTPTAEALERGWAEGQALSLEEAVAYALEGSSQPP
jgi:predicted ATPase/class 3 adenylate cyclase